MSAVISTIVGLGLLLLAIVVHEAAHALALRNLGYRITEAGLGMPSGPRLVIDSKRLPFRVSVSPLLLGAYVKPEARLEDEIDSMRYLDVAWYLGAGVIANLLLGGVAWCLYDALHGRWIHAATVAAGTVVVWFGRRLISGYVLPVIGIPLLGWLVYLLVSQFGQPEGPIAYGHMASEVAVNVPNALGFTYGISIALAIINLMPIYPLDGGRIADTIITRLNGALPARLFRRATSVVTLFIVVYAVLSDVLLFVR